MTRATANQLVVGVDLGTTSTKVIGYDVQGRRHGEASRRYPLLEPEPGQAVQDPDAIAAAVVEAVTDVVVDAHRSGSEVAGLSFSSAMHSLIALDGHGRPITPVVTWADLRAIEQAERLRATPSGLELHRRTGTPVHPMSPLTKLLWFREHDPDVFARASHWLGIKEYVLAQLTGEYVMDVSIASGTGLLDLATQQWWPVALDLAGVHPEQLPRLVPTTERLALGKAARDRLDLGDVPVVVGAGDGPLANLGVGAVRPGEAACSLGTSGAIRVIVEQPGVDADGRVFCYALADRRWAVGGAVSNGGIVLQWAGDALAPELGEGREQALLGLAAEALLGLAAEAPPGSDGLLMLPYLLSERAPHWSALAKGAYIGLTRAHRRPHLVRAALEGVCQQLALVLQSVRAAGNEVQALGLIDNLDVTATLVPVEEIRHPDPDAAALYGRHLAIFAGLYDALAPVFTALRAIG